MLLNIQYIWRTLALSETISNSNLYIRKWALDIEEQTTFPNYQNVGLKIKCRSYNTWSSYLILLHYTTSGMFFPLVFFSLFFLQDSYNAKRGRRESPLIYNKKQGAEGKHGLAENLKPRFSLPPSPNFFSLQEVPCEKDSLNSRYFSKTLLEQSLVYPIWQCKVWF